MPDNTLPEWNLYTLTPAGEAELAKASLGLSFVQRKLLGNIRSGAPIDQPDDVHKIDSDHLQRDMQRLAQLGLISNGETLQVGPAVYTAPAPEESTTRKPPWAVMLGVAGVAIIAVGAWILLRDDPSESKPPSPVVTAQKSAAPVTPIPAPSKPPAEAAPPAIREEPAATPPPSLPASEAPRKSAIAPEAPVAKKSRETKDPVAPPKAAPKATAVVPPPPPPEPVAKTPRVVENQVAQPAAKVTAPKLPAALTEPDPDEAPHSRGEFYFAPKAPLAPAPAVVVHRELPVFPPSALQKKIESGKVRARLAIDPTGKVTQVQIISSNPPQIFDEATSAALSKWRFQASPGAKAYDAEFSFSMTP